MSGKLFIHSLSFFLKILPYGVCRSFAIILGWFWFYVVRIRRETVLSQLHQALGEEYSEVEYKRIARGVFVNQCLNILEFLRFDPSKPNNMISMVKQINMDRYERAAAKGNGVLVLTAHFGNFDLLCCSQALDGKRIAILSKEISPSWLNEFWMESRSKCGIRILPDKGSWDAIVTHLEQGHALGYVLDQHTPGRRGVVVDFFGISAATSSGLARLALATGAAVIPIFIFRESGGMHRMEIGDELPIIEGENEADTILKTTESYNKYLENIIRKSPEQWLWLHRRWKVAGAHCD